jgi:hypothetical protein
MKKSQKLIGQTCFKMGKKYKISGKTLGSLLIIGIIFQVVFPQIKLGNLSWIALAIYLSVAIYLFLTS